MPLDHALEDVLEIGVRLYAVELRRGDEGADDSPTATTAVGAGEQMVLAPEGDGPDGAFDRIVVEFDAAVVEEAAERRPARKRVADRLSESAAGRNAAKLLVEPQLHR